MRTWLHTQFKSRVGRKEKHGKLAARQERLMAELQREVGRLGDLAPAPRRTCDSSSRTEPVAGFLSAGRPAIECGDLV